MKEKRLEDAVREHLEAMDLDLWQGDYNWPGFYWVVDQGHTFVLFTKFNYDECFLESEEYKLRVYCREVVDEYGLFRSYIGYVCGDGYAPRKEEYEEILQSEIISFGFLIDNNTPKKWRMSKEKHWIGRLYDRVNEVCDKKRKELFEKMGREKEQTIESKQLNLLSILGKKD